MIENNQMDNETLTEQSQTISLFQFIRELNKLKQKAILNTKDYPWVLALSDLPNDPGNIKVFYRDHIEGEAENADETHGSTLLSVHKPEFQQCPEPDATFKEWLLPGWDSYRNEAQAKEFQKAQVKKKLELLMKVRNFSISI